MLSIYDIQWRRFRNNLEHLQKTRETPASQRASLRSDDAEQALENLAEREAILHAHQLMSYPVATVQLTLDIVFAWGVSVNSATTNFRRWISGSGLWACDASRK